MTNHFAAKREGEIMAHTKEREWLPLLLAPATLLFALIALPSQAPAQAPQAVDAELQKKINSAIDKGIAYLKGAQFSGDADNDRGLRALVAWTLLESGVDAQEPAVKDLIQKVRWECIRGDYDFTYSLGLAILLFDKLGDAADVPLIHSAAVRLLHGQNANGGWDYHCPRLSTAEQERLATYLQQVDRSKTATDAPLAPEIVSQLNGILAQKLQAVTCGDNSNTQFAVMGLWAARRHQIPIQRALSLCASRFRHSQFPSGGWSYLPSFCRNPKELSRGKGINLQANRTMTAIALYVLASDEGLKNTKGKAVNLLQSREVANGVRFLEGSFDKLQPNHAWERMCYYLFALEKTALVFDLKTLNNKDWYAWGADWLVNNQNPDGSWHGPRGESANQDNAKVDTCFALLFLKRTNPAPDLALNLKGLTKEPIRKTTPESLPKAISDPHALDQPLAIPDAERRPGVERPPEEKQVASTERDSDLEAGPLRETSDAPPAPQKTVTPASTPLKSTEPSPEESDAKTAATDRWFLWLLVVLIVAAPLLILLAVLVDRFRGRAPRGR